MVIRVGSLPEGLSIVDRSPFSLTGDILEPFAVDELLCGQVAQGRMPIVHIWRHTKAFVMGLRDRRLPNAVHAMQHLQQRGYAIAVRHSGGAAVPLDDGVVNISLILPKQPGEMEYNPYFELMFQLLQRTLQPFSLKVDRGEIQGSYCPGDYDLSIDGRKFCGLAQRRQTKAFVVQAFVSVEGQGEERAHLAKQFYHIAANDGDRLNENPGMVTKVPDYPVVEPATMISLNQVHDQINVASFVASLTEQLRSLGGTSVDWSSMQLDQQSIQQVITDLHRRYDRS